MCFSWGFCSGLNNRKACSARHSSPQGIQAEEYCLFRCPKGSYGQPLHACSVPRNQWLTVHMCSRRTMPIAFWILNRWVTSSSYWQMSLLIMTCMLHGRIARKEQRGLSNINVLHGLLSCENFWGVPQLVIAGCRKWYWVLQRSGISCQHRILDCGVSLICLMSRQLVKFSRLPISGVSTSKPPLTEHRSPQNWILFYLLLYSDDESNHSNNWSLIVTA